MTLSQTMQELEDLKKMLEQALELSKSGDTEGANKLLDEYVKNVILKS